MEIGAHPYFQLLCQQLQTNYSPSSRIDSNDFSSTSSHQQGPLQAFSEHFNKFHVFGIVKGKHKISYKHFKIYSQQVLPKNVFRTDLLMICKCIRCYILKLKFNLVRKWMKELRTLFVELSPIDDTVYPTEIKPPVFCAVIWQEINQ